MEPGNRFAINLKRRRQFAGLSQQELGDRCRLHRSEISGLEGGVREPRLGTLVKLADALGVSVGSLCAGIAWDEDAQRFVRR
jgi:transcriptional regulator with XRE-family HTH domain